MNVSIKRLSSNANGLAFYKADPVTGAVESRRGFWRWTTQPGEEGYLQVALENAQRAGTYLPSDRLPEDGLSSKYSLNIDLDEGVGVLLLVDGKPSQIHSPFFSKTSNSKPNQIHSPFSGKVSNSDLQIFSSFNAANPNGDVQFISYDLATGGIAYLAEDTSASGNSDRDFNDFSIELTPESDSPTRIPNSNPWINADQTSFVTRSDLDPEALKNYQDELAYFEAHPQVFGDLELEISLVLNRREVDHAAIEKSDQYKIERFYDANELTSLSYKDLYQYTKSLSQQDLTDLYGADPTDIEAVVGFLAQSGATDIDTTNAKEQRTITFTIKGKNFVESFTDGSLLINPGDLTYLYVNRDGDFSKSYLDAQGNGAEAFAQAILGVYIDIKTTSNTTDSNETNRPNPALYDYINPIDVAKAYQFPGVDDSTAGAGARIGLVGSGSTKAMLDWQDSENFREYLLQQGRDPSAVPRFESLTLEQTSNGDTPEQMLDVGILTSISPGASIIESEYYGDLYRRYASLIYLDNPVDVISSSDQDDIRRHYSAHAYEQLYLDAILRGIPVVVASGDRGIANSVDGSIFLPGRGKTNPTENTGSAAILSVGGTTFSRETMVDYRNNGTGISPYNQLTWNENKFNNQSTYTIPDGVVAESGISTFSVNELNRATHVFDLQYGVQQHMGSSGSWLPSSQLLPAGYQRDHMTGIWSKTWRAYPDNSMFSGSKTENGTRLPRYAAPSLNESGYFTTHSAGTSAAAPLVAGLIANITSELRRSFGEDASVGFLNPLLYELYGSGLGDQVFFDVPSGSNNSNVFATPTTPEEWDGIYAGYDIKSHTGKAIFYPLNGTLSNGELDRGLSATALGFDSATGLGSLNGMGLLNQLTNLYPLL